METKPMVEHLRKPTACIILAASVGAPKLLIATDAYAFTEASKDVINEEDRSLVLQALAETSPVLVCCMGSVAEEEDLSSLLKDVAMTGYSAAAIYSRLYDNPALDKYAFLLERSKGLPVSYIPQYMMRTFDMRNIFIVDHRKYA